MEIETRAVESVAAHHAILQISAALMSRGASRVPHRAKSLMAHLRGTYDILRAWDQPTEVCLAGFMHSVYSTDAFRTSLFGVSDRETVLNLIGKRSEELVFLFCGVNRRELFATIDSGLDSIVVKNRVGGGDLTLTQRDAGDLLPIYMANLADQANARDGSPSIWLAEASRIGRMAARYCERVPPIFADCRLSLDCAEEAEVLRDYLRFTSSVKDLADNDFAGLVKRADYVPEPWIWLGLITIGAGDASSAARLGRHAREAMKAFGVAWDRRLSPAQWAALIEFLEGCSAQPLTDVSRVAQVVTGALESYQSPPGLYRDLLPLLNVPQSHAIDESARAPAIRDVPSDETASVPERFQAYIAGFGKDAQGSRGGRMRLYPGLSAHPFYDAASFPLATALERSAAAIIKEFAALRPSDFHREAERIPREGSWDIFTLFERGRVDEEHCRACPITSNIILANGGMQTLSGSAYFSRLAPGTKIAAHTGPTNMRLRCHLGIKVSPLAGIRVDGQERSWTEGKCLVLNDLLLHEAWNHGDEERVVLVVDFWHPDLTGVEVDLLEGLQRYAHSHAMNLTKYWQNNERARNETLIESGSNGAASLMVPS